MHWSQQIRPVILKLFLTYFGVHNLGAVSALSHQLTSRDGSHLIVAPYNWGNNQPFHIGFETGMPVHRLVVAMNI